MLLADGGYLTPGRGSIHYWVVRQDVQGARCSPRTCRRRACLSSLLCASTPPLLLSAAADSVWRTYASSEPSSHTRRARFRLSLKRRCRSFFRRLFQIWNTQTGEEMCVLEGHKNVVYAIAFNNPFGDRVRLPPSCLELS